MLESNSKKPSDVDKVFDIQRQIDGAHVAWLLAHQSEHYWDDSGKLHSGTSREFKTKVRDIMGPAWCQDNGHRLNATRTKEGILRPLAQAARVANWVVPPQRKRTGCSMTTNNNDYARRLEALLAGTDANTANAGPTASFKTITTGATP